MLLTLTSEQFCVWKREPEIPEVQRTKLVGYMV